MGRIGIKKALICLQKGHTMSQKERKQTKAKGARKRGKKKGRLGNGEGTLVWRGKYWQARWYKNGKLVSRSTGTADLDEAKDFLQRMSVVRRGQDDRAVVQKLTQLMSANLADVDTRLQTIGIPVRDLFRLYSEAPNRHAVAPRTLEVYGGQLNVLNDWLRIRHPEITSVRDVSQAVADEYIADRAKDASPSTVNKDLNLFSAVWRTLARKYGLEYNPWSEEHIARKRLEPKTRRALTHDEVQALLDNSSGELRLMVLLGVSTGLRLGDILNLSWDQVDLERRLLTIHRTRKTGAPVCLPIVDDLFDALKAQREATDSPFVLPEQHARAGKSSSPSVICQSMRWLFKRAGIKSQQDGGQGNKRKAPLATFHSLRHTFVSRLITRGVNPAIVREAVGHSTMLMTEHYTHIDAATLQAALKP